MEEKMTTPHIRIIIYVTLVLSLFLGIGIGLLIGVDYYKIKIAKSEETPMRVKGYRFISPLLDYEEAPELKDRVIITLKHKLEKLIEEKIDENKAIYISVYFRDLMNGPWFAVNGDQSYSPASLLKVPLMIAYLKYAEQNPQALNYKLTYDAGIHDDVRPNILPDRELEMGKSYTVEELIYRMIVFSDNIAKDLLSTHISEEVVDNIFKEIGIIVPGIREKSDYITAKDYSSFFRILFNASYLNRVMSEKALEILSKTTFKAGITAGIPADVIVSHKFAERGFEANQTMELHDCGIVYYKKRPYLLCIMTTGRNFTTLANIIENISSIVYHEIDKNY